MKNITNKTKKQTKVVKSSKKTITQVDKLYNYLSKHGKISRAKALSLGISSVSGAVIALRNRGVNIKSSLKYVKGKTFATYTLSK